MRNGAIDASRFLAACGIALFHSHAPGASIALSALPLFTIYLVYFAKPHKWSYLMLLWAGWSVFYGLLKIGDVVVFGSSWGNEFNWSMLLTGPALHLWFLPFAAVMVLIVRFIPLHPALLAVGAVAGFWASSQSLPVPLAQWVQVLPAVFLGLALKRGWGVAVALGALFFGQVAEWHVLQTGIAVLVAWVCLNIEIPQSSLTDWMRNNALYVYLLHPFVIAVVLRIGIDDPIALTVLGIAGSIVLLLAWSVASRMIIPAKPTTAS